MHATLTNVIALNVIRYTGENNSVGNMLVHFQNGRHKPEIVISHHLWHCIAPARDKSDGTYANSVQQLLHIKLITKGANWK